MFFCVLTLGAAAIVHSLLEVSARPGASSSTGVAVPAGVPKVNCLHRAAAVVVVVNLAVPVCRKIGARIRFNRPGSRTTGLARKNNAEWDSLGVKVPQI